MCVVVAFAGIVLFRTKWSDKGVSRNSVIEIELATSADIARALRSSRSRLAVCKRRIARAERLAGELLQWRALRVAGVAPCGFRRAA